ncbi:hypothetical protein SORBI_3003G386300 [Sorghum bicolor]|uniref:peptidylprolyl isomerase n=1 Tax=Sorghum bicolor TaxID=4558 RepID=A0A1B6Q7H8_SORBI|nr:hypothetical protein SORBI_3003G386300 [Sorghum bicolor]
MASAATLPRLQLRPRCNSYFQVTDQVHAHIKTAVPASAQRISTDGGRRRWRHTFLPVSAVGTGRGSSVTEADRKSDLSLENVKTSIVSRDDEKINVRVQLPGKATQKVFDEALTILARDAPPVPGFRKSKGDYDVAVLQIPSSILLQMLGKSRVTKFVLQEILTITIEEFIKKENLKVKPEIKTTQSEGEMESAFAPGSAFGFNVILELEKSDSDEDSDSEEKPHSEEDSEEKPDSDDDLKEKKSGSSE